MVTLQEEEERMTRYQEEMLTRVMELHQVILNSIIQTNFVAFNFNFSVQSNNSEFEDKSLSYVVY